VSGYFGITSSVFIPQNFACKLVYKISRLYIWGISTVRVVPEVHVYSRYAHPISTLQL